MAPSSSAPHQMEVCVTFYTSHNRQSVIMTLKKVQALQQIVEKAQELFPSADYCLFYEDVNGATFEFIDSEQVMSKIFTSFSRTPQLFVRLESGPTCSSSVKKASKEEQESKRSSSIKRSKQNIEDTLKAIEKLQNELESVSNLVAMVAHNHPEEHQENIGAEEVKRLFPPMKHIATCDACLGDIIGHRYKCLECSDYDLCEKCDKKSIHYEHALVRIAHPTETIIPSYVACNSPNDVFPIYMQNMNMPFVMDAYKILLSRINGVDAIRAVPQKAPAASPVPIRAPAFPPIKHTATCDSCLGKIIGHRYKCLECADYDLCEKCEKTSAHYEHAMVRIVHPIQTLIPSYITCNSPNNGFSVYMRNMKKMVLPFEAHERLATPAATPTQAASSTTRPEAPFFNEETCAALINSVLVLKENISTLSKTFIDMADGAKDSPEKKIIELNFERDRLLQENATFKALYDEVSVELATVKLLNTELSDELTKPKLDETEDTSCSICYGEMTIKCLQCRQRFDRNCIEEWLKRSRTCPMCRVAWRNE